MQKCMSSQMAYDVIRRYVDELARQCGRDPADIVLVAVTKTEPMEQVLSAYAAGCRDFGESRVQEALEKIPLAPQDCRWHLIGTLQANKVNKVVGQFVLIHSVDSVVLAQKISQCSVDRGVVTPILLQVNTSGEVSKHGLTPDQCRREIPEVFALGGVAVRGLMTMAPLTEDEQVIRRCFSGLRNLRNEIMAWDGVPACFRELSMGMSHDYPLAIQEGATILRIGSAIFGNI